MQRAAQQQAEADRRPGRRGDRPGLSRRPGDRVDEPLKAIGTIGGLTMVSRVLGFARDMIGSRMLGASHANDAFNFAFLLPNIFRRLFGEGAFASGFVPLFSQRLASGRT